MVTGSVTHDAKLGGHEQVTLPAGWKELAATVNASATQGKVLVLPLADYYQLPTTWGYYGTDNLATGLIERPVIVRNVDGYIGDASAYRQLVEATQQAVLGGRSEEVLGLLRLLGATQVVVRTDIARESPARRVDVADAEQLLAALGSMPGVHDVAATSVGSVFVPDDTSAGVLQVASDLFASRFDARTIAAQAAALPAGVALTDDATAAVTGRLWAEEAGGGGTVVLGDATPLVVGRPGGGTAHYRATLEDGEDGWRLVLRDASPVALGDAEISRRPELALPLGGEVVGLEVAGTARDFHSGDVIDVPAGAAVRALSVSSGSIAGDPGPLGDCNRVDGRSAAEVGIAGADLADDAGPILQLAASAHRACRAVPLEGARAGGTYEVVVAARSLGGSPPAACLWVDGPKRCLGLPGAGTVDGWEVRRGLVTLPEGTTGARLFLYADGNDDGTTTVTQYRLPVVRATRVEDRTVSVPAGQTVSDVTLPAGNYELQAPSTGAVPLGPWTPVGDCNRSDGRSLTQAGITMTAIDGGGSADEQGAAGIELEARAHSACTSAELGALRPGESYELRLEHRNGRGRPPRVCVYDRTNRRCLKLTRDGQVVSSLPATVDWEPSRLVFDAPEGGAGPGQVQVFLYADGTEDGTVAAYRGMAVAAASRDVVTLRTPAVGAAPPTIEWERRSASEYRARVRGATAPFILTLADTYSDRWRLTGLPGGDRPPVEVNGYANGWAIDATGDLDLTVRYTPDLWARRAVVVSLGALVIVAFLVAVRLIRVGVRRPAGHRAPRLCASGTDRRRGRLHPGRRGLQTHPHTTDT
jgi:arabinofuranan 3-O-arabinosyltransferase